VKKFLIALAALCATSAPAFASDFAVSVNVGQPGFYGQIDVGGFPPPVVLYRQPVMIERVPVGRPPIYLRVPPGHAKHWSNHCYEYNACGERVYFVRDDWYAREYVPRYREPGGEYPGYRDNHNDRYDRHGERGHYRDDRRGDYREDPRERDHGRGHER